MRGGLKLAQYGPVLSPMKSGLESNILTVESNSVNEANEWSES